MITVNDKDHASLMSIPSSAYTLSCIPVMLLVSKLMTCQMRVVLGASAQTKATPDSTSSPQP
jgi:hypothetical protein